MKLPINYRSRWFLTLIISGFLGFIFIFLHLLRSSKFFNFFISLLYLLFYFLNHSFNIFFTREGFFNSRLTFLFFNRLTFLLFVFNSFSISCFGFCFCISCFGFCFGFCFSFVYFLFRFLFWLVFCGRFIVFNFSNTIRTFHFSRFFLPISRPLFLTLWKLGWSFCFFSSWWCIYFFSSLSWCIYFFWSRGCSCRSLMYVRVWFFKIVNFTTIYGLDLTHIRGRYIHFFYLKF